MSLILYSTALLQLKFVLTAVDSIKQHVGILRPFPFLFPLRELFGNAITRNGLRKWKTEMSAVDERLKELRELLKTEDLDGLIIPSEGNFK